MLAPDFSSSRGRNVFISFVPQGEKALRRSLIEALSPLSRRGLINLWSDDEIQGGQQREKEISRQLQAAHIILLLVSPACMASSEWNQQMNAIMAREKSACIQIVPVPLRPIVGWRETSFGHLAPLPADGKPVILFNKPDVAWFKVAEGIQTLLVHMEPYPPLTLSRRMRTQPPTPHPAASVPRPGVVDEIYRRLAGAEVSALVLTGMYGLGKSALAAQVCQLAEERRQIGRGPFRAEALWFDLDSTTSLLDVLKTLCEVEGVALPSFQTMTGYDLVMALCHLLKYGQRPCLIVLNQFETWLHPHTRYPSAEHAEIDEWLELLNSQLYASRVLLTSRVYPRGKKQQFGAFVQRKALTGMSMAEGIQLLRQGKIAATDEELALAVTYYQGHPLALALLRNLLKENRSLSLTALMQDLSYKQLLIDDLAENILHYIYTQQLSQEQRELLLAFAIYRQPVTFQAVHKIVQIRSAMSIDQALTALRVLLDQDLVQAVGNLEYRLPPVLNDFIQAGKNEPHLDGEQRQQAHRIAAAYYQERFSSSLQHIVQPDIDDWRLLLEMAWHYCQAEQYAEAYHLMCSEQLFFSLHRWGGNRLLLDLYQRLLPPEKWHTDPQIIGQVYHEMGNIQNALGQKYAALQQYERALPFLRQVGQAALIAEALNDLGTVRRALKQEEQAEACYQEAWSLCEQADRYFAQRGITLNNIGRLCYEQGQRWQHRRQKEEARSCSLKALDYYQQALVAHCDNNLLEEEGWTLLNLGDVYAVLEQPAMAQERYNQALKRFRELGMRRGEGTVLNNLGLLLAYDSVGKERAGSYYIQALRIFRAVADRWQERKCLRNLGRWLMIYAPEQESARSRAYIRGLACFFAAHDVLEEQRKRRSEIIPGWLLASSGQELGEQKMQELVGYAETNYWQIIEEMINVPHDFGVMEE